MNEIKKAAIYTKKGDAGQTSLVDGGLVSKSHGRVQAYGDVDELNSVIGLFNNSLRPHPLLHELMPILFKIQNHLFNMGSLLACEKAEIRAKLPHLDQTHIQWLETQIDFFNHPLPELKEFILPGGHESSAWAHMARTVCRRTERKVTELSQQNSAYQSSLIYLNRLSDFFFIAARWIHLNTETPEIKWDSKA